MARPKGSSNKSIVGQSANSVATQLKKQLAEQEQLLILMGTKLYDTHDLYLRLARTNNDVEMAYAAGELKAFLESHGIEAEKPSVEKQIGHLVAKAAAAGAVFKRDDDKPDGEGTGKISSIMGSPPAREA